MAELKQSDLENDGSEELRRLIDHWVHVIDSWVQSIDQGMGGTAEGADPVVTRDPAPGSDPTSPPALESG